MTRPARALGVVVVTVLVVAATPARAEVGWSGAVRVGVGGALTGPGAGAGNVDLGFRFDVMGRRGPFDTAWGGGGFFDARTLGFQRHDFVFGGGAVTPDFYNLFAAAVRAGVGYRWRSDDRTGAVIATTFTVGVRLPIDYHEEVILGIYTDARVLLVSGAPTELTTGIEVDPVGIIAGLYEKVRGHAPR